MRNIKLDDEQLESVFNMGTVDCVPLLVNKKETDFQAVNMYVDDQGMAKKLPVNKRASALCYSLGKVIQVLGDAFIARYLDDDNRFVRSDFLLQDIDTSKEWMKTAKAMNIKFEEEENMRKKTLSTIGKKTSADSFSKTCSAGHITPACHNPAPLRCARCKTICYCSPDHQKEDWPRHKKECNELKSQQEKLSSSSSSSSPQQ